MSKRIPISKYLLMEIATYLDIIIIFQKFTKLSTKYRQAFIEAKNIGVHRKLTIDVSNDEFNPLTLDYLLMFADEIFLNFKMMENSYDSLKLFFVIGQI